MSRMKSGLGLGLVVAGLVAVGGVAEVARGQVLMIQESAGSAAVAGGRIRSVEPYAKLLGLSKDEAEAAAVLHEAYLQACREAGEERRKKFAEMREGGPEAAMARVQELPKIMEAYRERVAAAEAQFFDDLAVVVMAEAKPELWEAAQRMRRREVGLRSSPMGGAAVDLVEVVDSLKLPAAVAAEIGPSMLDYELAIDRQIQARDRAVVKEEPLVPGRVMSIEEIEERNRPVREATIKLREVNEQHARRIQAALPAEYREAFDEAWRKRAFPFIYKATQTERELAAAEGFADLTTEQREQVALLREAFERDLKRANEALESAMREEDEKGMVGPGGARVRLFNGPREDTALDLAKKAKAEMAAAARERLGRILNEGQKKRLPEPEPEAAEQVFTGERVMIIDR